MTIFHPTDRKCTTYDVDDLREAKTHANSQRVGGVSDRTYQLVVAAMAQFVLVQPFSVGLRQHTT